MSSPDLREQRSVAVLVPTLHRPESLKRLLNSVYAQTTLPLRVVVIDQSDDNRTKETFSSIDLGPIEKVYIHSIVKGLTQARNIGIQNCGNTDYLCFFDDDLELLPDYLEKLLIHFDQDREKKYAGGMGRFVNYQAPRDPLTTKIFGLCHHGDGRFLASKVPTWPWGNNCFLETEFVSGGMTIYRTDIAREFMFDENLLGYGHGDDVDFSYRVSRQYKFFFEPSAECHHHHVVTGRDNKKKHRAEFIQNVHYLHRKYGAIDLRSRLAYWWFVLGHFIFDFLSASKSGVLGDCIGVYNVLFKAPRPLKPRSSN